MNGFDLHHFNDYDSVEGHTSHGHHHHHSHLMSGDLGSLNAVAFKLFGYDASSNTIIAISLVTAVTQLLIACSPKLSGLPLNFLVAFAEGGMLGNIFLHMLPEIEYNTSSGIVLLSGFLGFVMIDKSIRILGDNSSHSHSHSHSNSPSQSQSHSHLHSHSSAPSEKKNNDEMETTPGSREIRQKEDSVQNTLTPWLNVVADSLHNITDGVSLALAFRQGTGHGFSAFLMMCCHEIPHQFGDFALLISSGASKSAARKAQLVTACGTLLGGLLGNWLGALGSYFEELVTPLTAGVYLYIATVGILPELLETDLKHSAFSKIVESFVQLAGIVLGIYVLTSLS